MAAGRRAPRPLDRQNPGGTWGERRCSSRWTAAPPLPWGLLLSHMMYRLVCSRKSTPPQNCQLNILISNLEQLVDDSVGELTF